METRLPTLVLGVLAVLGSSAFARLGETEAECAARYGAPITTKPSQPPGERDAEYSKTGIRVLVTFADGRAVAMAFSRPGGLLSEADIQVLLDANAAGAGWVRGAAQDYDKVHFRSFTRADGKAKADATMTANGGSLRMVEETFQRRRMALKTKLEAF